jgi:hypothetical protein
MMAVLLMDICPNLNRVHMVWSPVDKYSILCLPPVLSMVHPSGPSMAAITHVDLCSHSNNVCGNSKSFPALGLGYEGSWTARVVPGLRTRVRFIGRAQLKHLLHPGLKHQGSVRVVYPGL